jgi:hypothetical protein
MEKFSWPPWCTGSVPFFSSKISMPKKFIPVNERVPEHRALTNEKLIQRHMALEGIFIIRNVIMAHLCLVDTNVDRHSTRPTLGAPALFVRPSFVILAQDVKCASLRNLRMTKWLIETRKGTRSFGRLTASINLIYYLFQRGGMRDQIAHRLPGVYNANKTYAWVRTWYYIAKRFYLQATCEEIENLGNSYIIEASANVAYLTRLWNQTLVDLKLVHRISCQIRQEHLKSLKRYQWEEVKSYNKFSNIPCGQVDQVL